MSGNAVTQITELLRKLRSGSLQPDDAVVLEQLPADEIMAELRANYPIVFQERSVGRKREVGVARTIQFEVVARRVLDSLIPAARMMPVLRRCLFVSAYDNAISEVTTTISLHVVPGWADQNVELKMGRGYKLDRTPDGWVIHPLERRNVTLSEQLLASRGWHFDVLVPFHLKG